MKKGFVLDLETPYNSERNKYIEEIVKKYKNNVRMGENTLIEFCISMFCAGAEFQKEAINAELEMTANGKVIGNCFIASLNNAFVNADIVCCANELDLILEVAKVSFNDGIKYASSEFQVVADEVKEMERYL